MSREIIEFVQELERDKGIESDTLIEALEDALLAAYKKTPGASRHAVVELDREEGDFRVFSIELPPDIEERLLEEARERVLTELEQAELENGERSPVSTSSASSSSSLRSRASSIRRSSMSGGSSTAKTRKSPSSSISTVAWRAAPGIFL